MENKVAQSAVAPKPDDDEIDILEILVFLKSKWRFLMIFLILGVVAGGIASMWMRPAYSSDILLQVDVKGNKSVKALGEMGALLDASSPSEAEMQLLKSRMVLASVVEEERICFSATPLNKMDRLLHREGRMDLEYLKIPKSVSLAGMKIYARVLADTSSFEILDDDEKVILKGVVGETYRQPYADDSLIVCVRSIKATEGQVFQLSAIHPQIAVAGLLKSLNVAEEGKNSGIIRVKMTHKYSDRVAEILNSVANTYLKQNIEMRSAEAKKTLEFLEEQLPGVKAKLDSAEHKLTSYRHTKGTIDLSGETRVHLQKDVELQQKLLELEQKKQEALRLFQAEHPTIRTIEQQQAKLRGELAKQQKAAAKLPLTQQEVLSLQEEVEVNNRLYTNLLNNIQQLRVVQAGEVGNVRIVDRAYVPIKPSKPNRKLIFLGVVFGFLLFGCAIVLVRRMTQNGVTSSSELELATGIGVYGKLPLIGKDTVNNVLKPVVHENPDEPFAEGIRALRTALEFSLMMDKDKVLMVTGLVEGVGKSFVSINLASSFAMSGKKVLLVDMDLRRGHIFERSHKGLCEMLRTDNYSDEYIEKVFENFYVLASGKRVVNPGDLLGKDRFGKFLDIARSQYDLIILDTPPVFQCSDALLVEKYVDHILCVLKHASHSMESIQDALAMFDRSTDKPLPKAFVFNKCERNRSGYGYGGNYGYYHKKY